jgi:hypothetical protein
MEVTNALFPRSALTGGLSRSNTLFGLWFSIERDAKHFRVISIPTKNRKDATSVGPMKGAFAFVIDLPAAAI